MSATDRQEIGQEQERRGGGRGVFVRLFEDLSIAQVLAGALAAATALLLSSYIGVAGSVIGAAVASVVSAVTSQVYKKMLSASADKIRDVAPVPAAVAHGQRSRTEALDANDEVPDGASDRAANGGAPSVESASGTSELSQDTGALPAYARRAEGVTRVISADDVRYRAYRANDDGEDPALRRAHARRNRKERVKKQVLVVSVVTSLVVIAVFAAAVTALTAGEGIGTKPQHFFSGSAVVQDDGASDASTDSSSPDSGSSDSKGSSDVDESQVAQGGSVDSAGGASEGDGSSDAGDSSDAASGSSSATGGSDASGGSGSGSDDAAESSGSSAGSGDDSADGSSSGGQG